jgi:RsiW-degrading membrane proteinase PrsW (M82 family)
MELVPLLIWIAVLAIVVVAAAFILQQVPLPDPIRRIVLVALVAIVAILAIIILLRFMHVEPVKIGMLWPLQLSVL